MMNQSIKGMISGIALILVCLVNHIMGVDPILFTTTAGNFYFGQLGELLGMGIVLINYYRKS